MSLPFDPQQVIDGAVALHQQGRLQEAEGFYRQVLARDPAHFDALHLLGLVRHQQGDHVRAVELIARALDINPHAPVAMFNLAIVLQQVDRHADALAWCNRAIALKPDYIEARIARAWSLLALRRYGDALADYDGVLGVQGNSVAALNGRGLVLQNVGRHAEAVASFDGALAIEPAHADALCNRGISLRALGRLEEAVASYDRALAARPSFAEAANNRGNVMRALGRLPEAAASYDLALTLRPRFADALNNRGNVLRQRGDLAGALHDFDALLQDSPNYAEAWNNRAIVLVELKRFAEAIESCDKALALRPDFAEALCNRGSARSGGGEFEQAVADYDRVIALDPMFADAISNRAYALYKLGRAEAALAGFDAALAAKPGLEHAVYHRGLTLQALGRGEEAIASFKALMQSNPDHPHVLNTLASAYAWSSEWSEIDALGARLRAEVARGKVAIDPFFFLAYCDDPTLQLQCARNHIRREVPVTPPPLWTGGSPSRHDRIRVAYLSADFSNHATAHLIAQLFELHDRERFEIHAISYGPADGSPMRARLVKAFEYFHDVRANCDRDIAALVHALQVDIAVDLKGYTTDARPGILAFRPAPIQVTYLGFPGTMGTEFIDYALADAIVAPADEAAVLSVEKTVHLPDTFQINDGTRPIAEETPSRTELGLPEQGFVFCCFNNNYKIMPAMFDVWMALLRSVPGSVLWLLRDNAIAERNLRKEAAARGVDPARLTFAPRMRLDRHLARHRCADLFLDTLPVNAGTTASDALWAGLPLVTCTGNSVISRLGHSLLNAIRLPELVTHTLADYEALARALANDPHRLRAIRDRLARNRSTTPLFNTDRTRRHIEAAYVTMWEMLQRGEAPRHFAVTPVE